MLADTAPSAEDLALFREHTGRTTWPTVPAREAFFSCGRQAGKTLVMARLAVAAAAFVDVARWLAPGERPTAMLPAADRRQARVAMRYILGLLESTPALAKLIAHQAQESITLTNRVTLEIHTSSFKSVRGYSLVACIADELAFWPTAEESANPDQEILAAVRPALLSTIPASLLLAISSPYARKSALYQAFRSYYGRDDARTFVWKASTLAMNPTVDRQVIADAYRRTRSPPPPSTGASSARTSRPSCRAR
jgi:hypothetical protein